LWDEIEKKFIKKKTQNKKKIAIKRIRNKLDIKINEIKCIGMEL